jgi:ABC-type Zn uptake system ZnuABC Zn-binding protein ZnuA
MFWRRLGLWLVAPALVLLLGLSGCVGPQNPWGDAPSPRVIVTIPPLYSFVKNVGGKHVAIRCLCTSTGPHQYEPGTMDSIQFRTANLFLAIGLKLDDKFADKMATQSQNAQLHYIKLGDALPAHLKLKADEHDEHDEHGKDDKEDKKDDKHGGDHHHEHGDIDPHVWLGIEQAKAMVAQVRDALIEADSNAEHQKDYRENAGKYIERLDDLVGKGKKLLSDKKNKKIISFHESLQYFSRTFDLKVVDVFEQAPGSDPSATVLARLQHEVEKDDGPRVIAIEPQYDASKYKDKLGNKVKVEWVIVDPLETADEKGLKDDNWYETKILHSIEALAEKLR